MTKLEAQSFIERVLKGLWADWAVTDIQLSNWLQKLQNCEYQRAKLAVENVWRSEKIQHRRPPQGRIFEALSQCVDAKERKNSELPQTHVFISCIELPEHNPNRTEHKVPVYPDDLKRIDDPDYVRNCAHGMAERFKQLYGGHWIVVIEQPKPDSGLVGEEAREKAFEDILSGPETKTKRWLQGYFEGKQPGDVGAMALQALAN